MRTLIATTTLVSCSLVGTASFAQAETIKFRQIMHIVSAQAQDVGDVDGHSISVVKVSGLATFPDGSVAPINFTGNTDYTKGSGQAYLYETVTFGDGSSLRFKGNNKTVAEGQGAKIDGTLTVLGGTGKFSEAKGDGTFTGARLAPLPTTGSEIYFDFTINTK